MLGTAGLFVRWSLFCLFPVGTLFGFTICRTHIYIISSIRIAALYFCMKIDLIPQNLVTKLLDPFGTATDNFCAMASVPSFAGICSIFTIHIMSTCILRGYNRCKSAALRWAQLQSRYTQSLFLFPVTVYEHIRSHNVFFPHNSPNLRDCSIPG